jgi:ferric-dicitrate binding protein FerR (iron transport regulator)
MDDLLIKYLMGEATPDEIVRVWQWLSEDAGHREQYEQLKAVWEISGRNVPPAVPNAQQALQRLKRRLQTPEAAPANINPNGHPVALPASSLSKPLYRRLLSWRAAAVVAGIICIGAVAYRFLNRPAGIRIVKSPTAAPVPTIGPKVEPPVATHLQTDIAGSHARLDTLPDGSVVTLYRHANISYLNGLKGQARTVRLQGEAFFSVIHNPSRPFVVHANDITVKVLGTSFTIRSNTGNTEVMVKTGIVQVIRGVDSIVLHAGEKVAFAAFQDTAKHITQLTPQIDTPAPGLFPGKKHGKTFSAKDEIGKQLARDIIEDMVKAKIIVSKDSLCWFGLNTRRFVVDGKPVPDSLYQIFKSRYIGADSLGYYFGPSKIYGKGLWFERKDLY